MGEEDYNGFLACRKDEICTFVAGKSKFLEQDWRKGKTWPMAERWGRVLWEVAWRRGIHWNKY